MNLLLKLCILFLLYVPHLGATSANEWYTQQPDKTVTLKVDLFLSSSCLHCQKADNFFRTLEFNTPWLQVQRHMINENKNDLILFRQFLSAQHIDDFAVPSIFFCNARWVGFASMQTTGRDLLRALNYCKQQIEKKGTLTQATINVLRQQGRANLFDSGMVGNPSPFYYLLVVALMDAFNPCSFFSLAAFLGLLFIAPNRQKLLGYGLLFIVAIALVHYIQQVHSTLFFEWLPWLRLPAALIALLVLYGIAYYYKKGQQYSWFLGVSFFFAFILYAYQQTCAMNWSYVFEQWLYNRQVSNGEAFLSRFMYHLVYLMPLLVVLAVYYYLSNKNWFRAQAKLNTIGFLFITAIALLLLIYPLALAQMFLSLILLLGLALIAWIFT